jgi:hypothetical protein
MAREMRLSHIIRRGHHRRTPTHEPGAPCRLRQRFGEALIVGTLRRCITRVQGYMPAAKEDWSFEAIRSPTGSARVYSIEQNAPPMYRSSTGSLLTAPANCPANGSALSTGAQPSDSRASSRHHVIRALFDAPQITAWPTARVTTHRSISREKSPYDNHVASIRAFTGSGRLPLAADARPYGVCQDHPQNL